MVPAPVHTCGPARRASLACVIVLCGVVLSACGLGRGTSDARLTTAWIGVQEQFDRLAKFELDFRATAAAAVDKPEAEKLRFVRDALDRRSQLQLGLKRELRRFTRAAAPEPQAERMQYAMKVKLEMDKLRAIETGSLPAVKALALDKYEGELSAYQAQRDAELRSAR